MLSSCYLSLQLNRVRASEEWSAGNNGLEFILPRGGLGQYLSNSVSHPLSAGDVLVIGAAAAGHIRVANGPDVVFWSFRAQLEHLYPLFANNEICLLRGL